MAKKEEETIKDNPDEIQASWVSDLARISLLAEFIEDAFKENCDCRVCRKLRERAKAFIDLTRSLPKM